MATNEKVEILLVEDNPADVELTLRALKENDLGNHVLVLEDGVEILDYFFGAGARDRAGLDGEGKPKVILLDLKLPKVDGLEVLERLKKDERTRMIPVVVLTSSLDERDLAESYRLGANSYMTKPVDFDQFMQSISAVGNYWLLLNKQP